MIVTTPNLLADETRPAFLRYRPQPGITAVVGRAYNIAEQHACKYFKRIVRQVEQRMVWHPPTTHKNLL